MRTLTGVAVVIALAAILPQSSAAQSGTDAEYAVRYRDYWRQLQNELSVTGNDCAPITARLNAWVERNREDIDSLLAQSAGILDRMTEAQIDALLPAHEPLLSLVAQISARCVGVPEFRTVMTTVNQIIAMGS